jgi:hypothetical protein
MLTTEYDGSSALTISYAVMERCKNRNFEWSNIQAAQNFIRRITG